MAVSAEGHTDGEGDARPSCTDMNYIESVVATAMPNLHTIIPDSTRRAVIAISTCMCRSFLHGVDRETLGSLIDRDQRVAQDKDRILHTFDTFNTETNIFLLFICEDGIRVVTVPKVGASS